MTLRQRFTQYAAFILIFGRLNNEAVAELAIVPLPALDRSAFSVGDANSRIFIHSDDLFGVNLASVGEYKLAFCQAFSAHRHIIGRTRDARVGNPPHIGTGEN